MKKANKGCIVVFVLFLIGIGMAGTSEAAGFGKKQEILKEPETELELDDEDWEEILSGEGEDDEWEAFMEEYFQQMEEEEFPDIQEGFEKIEDPELKVLILQDGQLCYQFPNMSYFTSSVPCGMISSGPVELSLSAGCMGIIDQDGTSTTLSGSRRFTEKGNYHIQILSYQALDDSLQDYNLYELNFYFIITGQTDRLLGAVPAPEGFLITGVTLDGKQQEVENPRCFFLKKDGYYEIWYESEELKGITPRTSFIRDTTAPFLRFSPELEGEVAAGMVEFYPSEPDCRVYLTYNGEQGYAVSNQLTVAGHYRLRIEDVVGNTREYHLQIRANYRLFDVRVVGAVGVFLLLGLVWLFFQRQNMRVL